MTNSLAERDAEFARCFEQEMPRLLRYAQRHVGRELAQDVAAETFQIAWRKWDELPPVKFPWLVGTARKVIGNHVRAIVRRRKLVNRLALLESITANSDVDQSDRIVAVAQLVALNEAEREALLLVAWDGLSADDAARVLGVTPVAFRKRLSRARQTIAAAQSQPVAFASLGTEDKL